MIRSASAVLALVILSGFVVPRPVEAQQEARTHEVREGDTLWKIAQQYYDSGHMWNRIYEANRDRLDTPEALEVGLVLTIPSAEGEVEMDAVADEEDVPAAEAQEMAGDPEPALEEAEGEETEEAMAEVGEVEVEAPETPKIEQMDPQEGTGPKTIRRRTSFYPDTTNPTLRASMAPMLAAVSRDVVFSAPWLLPEGEALPAMGELVGFAGSEGDVTVRVSARPHDRVLVSFDGPAPAVGSLVQVYRIDHEIDELGSVVTPTGVLRIHALEPAGAVAEVIKLYAHMVIGDAVGPLPAYPLSEGQRAETTTEMREADIIGFANPRPMYSIGDNVFLAAGADSGIRIGDEYVVVFSSGEGWTGEPEGRLQVVGVHEDHATARIVAEESPVFALGVRVRLDRRMR